MDLLEGTVVISKAGRDKGYPLVVTGFDGGRVIVADGKERPLNRPKKKNPRHLAKTNKTLSLEGLTDRALRRALREIGKADKTSTDISLQESD